MRNKYGSWRALRTVFPEFTLLLLVSILFTACTGLQAEDQPLARPNIILIMADDMGFSDIASYGGEIETPHLDALADQGVRFTRFYNTARCTPTRASILTGLYPHQAGLGHMPDAYATRIRETFDSPAYTDHLAYDTPTVAEMLREVGYATYMTGKWHVGYDRPQWPVDRGFDRSFAVIEGAMNYYGYGIQHTGKIADPPMALDDEVFIPPREGFFATDAFTDYAVRFIREHDGTDPFFLYLSYTAPHWPLQAPKEQINAYRGRYMRGWDQIRTERYERLVQSGLIDSTWKLPPRPDNVPAWDSLTVHEKQEWDHEMAVYAAQVDGMDAGIGRVLAAIEQKGFGENTLVVFLSDNGGAAEDPNRSLEGATLGDRDSFEGYGIRGAHVSSAPFRRTKKYIHEGGIATPLIVRWPAAIREGGAVSRQVGHVIDLVPTFLAAADASSPDLIEGSKAPVLEGMSLLPRFGSSATSERTLFWEHQGNRGVRDGPWKLVSVFRGEWELYHMDADRTELNDMANDQPARVRRMAGLYEKWVERTGVKPWDLVASPEN